jgi:hypothetical protein
MVSVPLKAFCRRHKHRLRAVRYALVMMMTVYQSIHLVLVVLSHSLVNKLRYQDDLKQLKS